MYKIAILGPVGHNVDSEYITLDFFNAMLKHCEDIIEAKIKSHIIPNWRNVQLYTTGAAFSEYVAVELAYKHQCHIYFCMPCQFNFQTQRFINEESEIKTKFPTFLNKIHEHFSNRTGIDSLGKISEIMTLKTCQSNYFKEFVNIQKLLHRCNLLILFNVGKIPIEKSLAHSIYRQFKHDKICVICEKPVV